MQEYQQELSDALLNISQHYPDIDWHKEAALPVTGLPHDVKPHNIGFVEPFNKQTLSTMVRVTTERKDLEYFCGIPLLHINMVESLTPQVPIYASQVRKLGVETLPTPRAPKVPLEVAITWAIRGDGDPAHDEDPPPGSLVCTSPDEMQHSIVFRISDRLKEKDCSDEEKLGWRRVLLSCPVKMKFIVGGNSAKDNLYAAGHSARNAMESLGKHVKHTVRQIIRDVVSFRDRKKKELKRDYSGREASEFFKSSVDGPSEESAEAKRVKGGEQINLQSYNVVDACFTVHARLLSDDDCDGIVARWDSGLGQDSPLNSLWKMQAIVSRCQTFPKIRWFLYAVEDALLRGKLTTGELTIKAIESGNRSISDAILFAYDIKLHILTRWLPAKQNKQNI